MTKVLTHMCMSLDGFVAQPDDNPGELFAAGIRYFGELVGAHVMLEDPVVVQGTRALHLRYQVRR
jgi:hypothetical protein